MSNIIKLDYTIEDPQERLKLVNKILEEQPYPNAKYLEILSNYLVFCMEKKERREHKIITENRQVTLNKRETSWQALAEKLENGEDGIYNLANNKRSAILQPKISITEEDLQDIPDLRQLRDSIESIEKQVKTASGYRKFKLNNDLIEMRKTQYIIKEAFRKPLHPNKLIHTHHSTELTEEIYFDDEGKVRGAGVSLINPKVVHTILTNYPRLRDEAEGRVNDDLWYVLYDFEDVYKEAIRDYPIYEKIAEMKWAGYQNLEIQKELERLFDVHYTPEYISNIWCVRIPNIISSVEEDRFLDYYFLNVKKGHYKKCGKCGQIKLAHNKYFSKNSMSGDGFYSICKKCRNKKKKR